MIFPGSRTTSITELESHRQLPTPCERKDSSLKEGISDAQWAQLDKKTSSKDSVGTSIVEKWNHIWTVLFPDTPVPPTPCKCSFCCHIECEVRDGLSGRLSRMALDARHSEEPKFCVHHLSFEFHFDFNFVFCYVPLIHRHLYFEADHSLRVRHPFKRTHTSQ